MKSVLKSSFFCAALLLSVSAPTHAAVTFTVDPGAAWQGFMNVSELPSNGGAYVFGSGWGTADLKANFVGPTLTLSPNTVNDVSTFWYVGGGAPGNPGNKIMDASFYVQAADGALTNQTVTFTGNVLSTTFTAAHTSVAFIKDFAPDYSSFNVITAPIVNGVFSISLATINNPLRHVQYGFETIGVNVWSTDVAPFGSAQITAIPEPSGALLGTLGTAVLAFRRRRK